MAEMLEIFDLKGNYLYVRSRRAFYQEIWDEYRRTGRVTRQVRVVRFLVMTSDGRVYVQKRSRTKSENPGLYDKTVGGHCPARYPDDIAAWLECQQELAMSIHVLSDTEFDAVRDTIDLSIAGIMQQVERVNAQISIRSRADGMSIEQPLIVTYYIGYYDGSIRFKDGESVGVETYSLEELRQLIDTEPERCTEDLKYMVDHFAQYLVPFSEYKRM